MFKCSFRNNNKYLYQSMLHIFFYQSFLAKFFKRKHMIECINRNNIYNCLNSISVPRFNMYVADQFRGITSFRDEIQRTDRFSPIQYAKIHNSYVVINVNRRKKKKQQEEFAICVLFYLLKLRCELE